MNMIGVSKYTVNRGEAKKMKQVDQFGQGVSSKFSSDKFGQISSDK
jgi:hypothetical protein